MKILTKAKFQTKAIPNYDKISKSNLRSGLAWDIF